MEGAYSQGTSPGTHHHYAFEAAEGSHIKSRSDKVTLVTATSGERPKLLCCKFQRGTVTFLWGGSSKFVLHGISGQVATARDSWGGGQVCMVTGKPQGLFLTGSCPPEFRPEGIRPCLLLEQTPLTTQSLWVPDPQFASFMGAPWLPITREPTTPLGIFLFL